MSYNYKLGYYSHEESDYIELQHEKKFSDDEFTEIIAEATIETIKKMNRQNDRTHSFQDIFNSSLIDCLIEKFGFKIIGYELFWSVFGWASIFDKSDWTGDRDNHLDKITEAVNKAGFGRKDDDYLREDDEIMMKQEILDNKKDEETGEIR